MLIKGRLPIIRLVKWVYYVFAILFGLLIIIKSIDYVHPDFTTGFLLNKKAIFFYYRYALYAHIIGAPIAFFSSLFQISFPKSSGHKFIGKLYVASVLSLAAPGAFIMSFHAIGGFISTINFSLMTVLWVYFTIIAVRLVRKGRVAEHKKMMIRSYIMCQSAILLRLFSYLNLKLDWLPASEAYVLISILSWLPFLLIFELVFQLRDNS